MKFICTKDNLHTCLAQVSGIAGKQTNLPILSNILINVEESRVMLIATNLEIGIKVHLRAKVETPGSFTVPAKMLLDYVNLLRDEQIEIFLDGTELVVSAGSASTKIKGMPSDDFPVVPDVEEVHAFTFDADILKQGFSDTAFAVAKNEIRPELSGVYFAVNTKKEKTAILAATDSYRLAEKFIPVAIGTDEIRTIIPGKAVQEFIRLLGVNDTGTDAKEQARLWIGENQIAIRYGAFEITSRLIDGSYPDYTQIIPESAVTNVTIAKDVAVSSIKAASLFSVSGVNSVSLGIESQNNVVHFAASSPQTGEYHEDVDVMVQGEDNNIMLNFRYLLEGVQRMHADHIKVEINSPETPCVLRPNNDDKYLYIVMPIRQ